jgi:hypothetical protein
MLQRVPHQISASVRAEFVHHICAVPFDGVQTDRKQLGNLRIRLSLGDKPENLSFSGRESVGGIFFNFSRMADLLRQNLDD